MAKKWYADIFMTIALALTSCQTYSLQQGDLLFHVTSQPNAITDVTPAMIDHVAIVLSKDSVIEAVSRGVVITPIDSLRHHEGYYLVARVKKANYKRSVENARHYLGRPYDTLYLPDNDAIYCSELVQFSYVDKHGNLLFQPVPMSFHDTTGHITPYWQQFYAEHDMHVPEGEPGTNPAELSRRQAIRLIGPLK